VLYRPLYEVQRVRRVEVAVASFAGASIVVWWKKVRHPTKSEKETYLPLKLIGESWRRRAWVCECACVRERANVTEREHGKEGLRVRKNWSEGR